MPRPTPPQPGSKTRPPAADRLPAFTSGGRTVNAVIETPQGSCNKFKFDPESGLFSLAGAMPSGVVFPFEFGFIPSTLGEDGDPLDLLLLLDAPTFVGCLVPARIIGAILATQTEGRKTERNDRLIGVACASRRHEHVRALSDLPPQHLLEIEHFFISYNAVKGKTFRPLGRCGPSRALALLRKAVRAAQS